jgi:hypothetical protein
MKAIGFVILTAAIFAVSACKSSRKTAEVWVYTEYFEYGSPATYLNMPYDCWDTVDGKLFRCLDIDNPPLFNGMSPYKGFKEYIQNNLIYPSSLSEIKGSVIVDFIVMRDGSVSDVKVRSCLSYFFEKSRECTKFV